MQVISGADVSVDTFFLLSGFLMSYVGLRKMRGEVEKGRGFGGTIGKAILLRYLR